MRSEVILKNAAIEIKTLDGAGRPVVVNTNGNVSIRTKKKPWETGKEFYVEKYLTLPDFEEYEIVGDLEEHGGYVFTIKEEQQVVVRSTTAEFGKNVEIELLAKRLNIPAEHVVKYNKDKTKVTFTWEEKI